MANGNGNGAFWKAAAVVLALLIQTTLVGVWKGSMDARVKALEGSVEHLSELVERGIDDRYRGTDAVRDWNEHMRDEHGKGSR